MTVRTRVHESENRHLSPSAGSTLDVSDEVTSKAFARALGEEVRRTREARGLTRTDLVARLPSGIGDRTLLAYEHGIRHLYAYRLVELCQALDAEAPTLLARALQRARMYLESLPLQVDLNALVKDTHKSGVYRPLGQWARNLLNEHPNGVVEVEATVVHNLALFIGCARGDLAKYLARFLPADAD